MEKNTDKIWFRLIMIAFFLAIIVWSCSKSSSREEESGKAQKTVEAKEESIFKVNSIKKEVEETEQFLQVKGKNQYISEKYGFALSYNQLMLNDKLTGNDVLELRHLSGDRAVLTIRKPESWEGNPEDYIKNAHKAPGQKIFVRREFKLGNYPALLAEFSQEVMKMKMRVIELTAVKDGYFYSLVVTMDERYVDDVRQEFDLVVNSFRLLEEKGSLEERWKDQLPPDFPHDVIPLYAVDEIYYVSGKSLAQDKSITVMYDSKESRENLLKYYQDIMKDAEPLPSRGQTLIAGVKSGYVIEINLETFESLKQTRVTVRIYPR